MSDPRFVAIFERIKISLFSIAPTRGSQKVMYDARVMALLGRSALAIMWLFAASAKLKSLDELQAMFRGFFPGIGSLAIYPSIALISTEALIALLLLLPWTGRLGLRLTAYASFLFIGVNVVRYADKIRVPCSCFGAIYNFGPLPMVGVDLAIVVVSLLLLRQYATAYTGILNVKSGGVSES
jgi:hypothetical protein